MQLILTLCHGQATVERGFSVNKAVLAPNLQETSLVAMTGWLRHRKTGNLAVNFLRQGNAGNLVNLIFYTGKIVATQGKF